MKNHRKEVLNKLKEVLESYDVKGDTYLSNIEEDVKSLIVSQHLMDKTGLEVHGGVYGNYTNSLSIRDVSFIYFGEGSQAAISWEDNNLTPKEGWYLKISYPSGAYTFNSLYPENTFNQFFQILRTFGADYCDSANKSLYFNVDTNNDSIKRLVAQYAGLYKEYWELAEQEVLKVKIDEVEKQLKALKGG